MRYLLIIILFFIVSCTTTKYIEVPVETIKTEYKDRLIYDSIYVKDSTSNSIKNDTVFNTKYKYIYKTRVEKDTINVTDTITKTITIEKEKEVNKLKNWQIVLMIIGGGSIALMLYKLKNLII